MVGRLLARASRILTLTMLLFIGTQVLAQIAIDRWPMHPSYKNLPAWVVDEVWRPFVIWRSNTSEAANR